MKDNLVLGIDIGGTALKGAVINIKTGELVAEKYRVLTPKPATTKAVASAFNEIVEHFNWKGKIGCGVPAIVRNGVTQTAANIDDSFIGANVQKLLSEASGCEVVVLNDADAAGIAELYFGVADGTQGIVIMLTLGTGIGSALFADGVLIQNTEFGHLKFEGDIAEKYCAESIRKKEDMNWKDYAKRLNKFLLHIELLFSPDVIILGGGGSKHFEKYEEHIELKFAKVVPAKLLNNAGIIGAAYFAAYHDNKT